MFTRRWRRVGKIQLLEIGKEPCSIYASSERYSPLARKMIHSANIYPTVEILKGLMSNALETHLTPDLCDLLSGLDTPVKIQAFLDTCAYVAEYDNRCPARVLAERLAHCLDGGLFGAMALRRLGFSPRVVDIFPDPGMDDDHVLAIFRVSGRYGAVAKSNFVGLRYREPVYRTLRELIMSYFEQFYNVDGVKTLRTYAPPLNLARFDRLDWEWQDAGADAIEKTLLARRRIALISPEMAAALSPVDPLTYKAGLLVANMAGLYTPKKGDA